MAAEIFVRRLGARAAVALGILTVACEPQSFAPDPAVTLSRPAVVRVPRARILERGDTRSSTTAGMDAVTRVSVADRVNTAFDATMHRVWILDSRARQLIEMPVGSGGSADALPTKRIDARGFGLRNPQGLAVDPASGRLFILDVGPRILRLDPHPHLGFQSPNISVVDLAAAGIAHARGIAFDPTTGHLHVLDPVRHTFHEVSQTGRLIATRDVSEFRLDDPQQMTVAPSGDATDGPSEMSLYVADGGHVIELSLAQPAVTALATTTAATLVRTTETSRFSPSSPDPSGIAYASHLGNLVIVDGEVEEMTIYAGANVFETTPSGSLTRSWTTTTFSIEPVGGAYNPANRHLFISDDDKRKVFELDPGLDGRYLTSDDGPMRSFDTRPFGSDDPEGLAYDAAQRILYIADGVNAEVYRLSPGANGVFDGVSPTGDDQVTSFDTQAHGLLDPEGIAFDSDLGQLYVSGKPATRVFQFSTSGALLGTLDVSVAHADKLAGLEYVPGTSTSTVRTLYIVDRGVDNDSDPRENDGMLYEFALPSLDGNTPPTVTITSPADGSTFTQGNAITFSGTASDAQDGTVTAGLTWTSSRDGTLGSGGSVSSSTLSTGSHTITASVSDAGGAQGTATISVTVNVVGAATVVQVRVATSADDAEEASTGGVSLSSSDLEMAVDGTINQTIGMRFNGLSIPRGATITRAWVQFQVDEASSDATSLTLSGNAVDNAAAFGTAKFNVSTRPRTTSAVSWSPVPWTTVNQQGVNQQTPNLGAIIQEITGRSGWQSGNSLALILTGTGRRIAEAYDGVPAAAPMLHVEYTVGPNVEPTATNVAISGTPQVGRLLTGNYTYSDANGDAEGASTYRWLRDGAPISGATAKTYTLAPADEGALITFEVTPVAASGASPGASVQSAAVGPVSAPAANVVPVASSATIAGTAQVGQLLTGSYAYRDDDADAEGTSTYRWLRDGAPISGATARSYTLVAADEGRLIRFEVTPVAASGASPGAPAQSAAVGPIAGAGTTVALQVRVAASVDDAEESATGSVSLTSSDLEMVFSGSTNQTIGMRFNGLSIPQGATITRAWVQFQVDEVTSDATSLTIGGQAADNAPAFTTVKFNVSSRPRTASALAWSPGPWTVVNQQGVNQQTPNIAAVVQEIVNRPGWQSGGALAIIITGTGRRIAEAYDGVPAAAPLLRVEYSLTPPTP